MFSKIKAWLRSIIAEEVAKVSVTLTHERAEAIATLKNVENDIARSLEVKKAEIDAVLISEIETAHAAFVVRLRATREHVASGEPSRWQADADTVAADHRLKVVK